MTSPHKQLAKDVAVQLDRRRRNRRVMFMSAWAALIAAAVLYLRCGHGWGLAGGGKGSGTGTGAAVVSAPVRCVVRVSASGIALDGKPTKREDVVAACKKTDGAMVTVTGDARQGDWDALRSALEAASITIYKRGD